MRMPDSHVCLKYEKPRHVICVRNAGRRLLPWCNWLVCSSYPGMEAGMRVTPRCSSMCQDPEFHLQQKGGGHISKKEPLTCWV